MNEIPVIIPAYEPDERLLPLLTSLKEAALCPVILVNDGSGEEYQDLFDRAETLLGADGTVLSYPENHGKGYALKTAFSYVLSAFPDATGCVTADSDGQHPAEAIGNVRAALQKHPDSLILGVRTFRKSEIPWKSWFGNTLTVKVFKAATGIRVSDTQTGLRGIPRDLMKQAEKIRENRFEFEMKMLIDSVEAYPVIEVPIQTIYESKEHHQTHFHPVRDSLRIYRLLLGRFMKYILSSLSSSLIDLGMFQIFCLIFKNCVPEYVALATVLARIISATYNYGMNYKVVFRSRENVGKSSVKYFALAVVQMTASALLVTGGVKLIPVMPELVVKIIVDTCLFFVSYYLQKRFIFRI